MMTSVTNQRLDDEPSAGSHTNPGTTTDGAADADPSPAPGTRRTPSTGTDAASLVDTAARLRLSVTRLARILRQQSDTDLTPTQMAVLATLHRCGPIPVGAVAEAEQVAAPTATKIVDKLHAAGLVERRADPADRRVALVALTDAGDELLTEIRARRTAWLTTRLADLPPPDVARLNQAIEVLEHLAAPEPRRRTTVSVDAATTTTKERPA
ncbi:hypothetical protein BH23ACT2_BH23ACT2_31240 [soil metagenome]